MGWIHNRKSFDGGWSDVWKNEREQNVSKHTQSLSKEVLRLILLLLLCPIWSVHGQLSSLEGIDVWSIFAMKMVMG